MKYLEIIKDSIKRNKLFWMVIWPLVLLNIFTYFYLSQGLSIVMVLSFIFITFIGIGGIKYVSVHETTPAEAKEELTGRAAEIMKEIRALGEDIFSSEIERITRPVRDNIRQDFARGLSWLWEDNQEFVGRVGQFLKDATPALTAIDPANEDRAKMLKLLNKDLDILATLVDELESNKERDYLDLDELIDSKIDNMKTSMLAEQDIFYDYVFKIINAQMKSKEENDEEIDVAEYFNVNKLGEQLSSNLISSLESRILPLQDSIIKELESFSADVVGKMQNNSLQMVNSFKDMKDLYLRLLDDCQGEGSTALKNINQSLVKVDMLLEQAEEIMLTLAWHDILVEKRWQDIQERLSQVRARVNENVDEDVISYITGIVIEEIPVFTQFSRNSDDASFAKALVDAELVYQLYSGEKLKDIIKDGVYSLLQFVRPLEILVKKNIRLREEGLQKRKSLNLRVRADEYQKEFDRVKEIVELQNPRLLTYLEEVYPKYFFAFCNNPYIKQKPEDLNQAAWVLFLDILDRGADDTIYFLVGVLLLVHQLRNKYIHPFKPLPINLESDDEIDHIRYAAYQAIDVMLSTDFKTLSTAASNIA